VNFSLVKSLEAWTSAVGAARLASNAYWFMPFCFGCVSLWLGLDANWDLRNYHLYNPYALLHGRLELDMAPAGFQSYFNPTIDLPYYLLVQVLPAPVVGFLLGAAHGTCVFLVYRIALLVIPSSDAATKTNLALFLAIGGGLTGSFLSTLGNTMGDNLVALFLLCGLYLLLDRLCRLSLSWGWASWNSAVAGGVVGLGVGLKLTAAPFAVSMCLALLLVPTDAVRRLGLSFWFGVGVLVGIAITAGWWHLHMWQQFGNPLFPQFSSIFPSPLAQDVSVADTKWRPNGFVEMLGWPFITAAAPLRVSEVRLYQVCWAALYLSLIWWTMSTLVGRWRSSAKPAQLSGAASLLLAYITVGYIVWMLLFSIYRYLVAIELLVPLAIYLVLICLVSLRKAMLLSVWATLISSALSVASVFLIGSNWGREPWAMTGYTVEVPAIPNPATSTIVVIPGDPPIAWVVPFFPKEVSFVGLHQYVLNTKEYDNRLKRKLESRNGDVFALIDGDYDRVSSSVNKANGIARNLGLTTSETGCKLLTSIAAGFKTRYAVSRTDSRGALCALSLAVDSGFDLEGKLGKIRERVAPTFAQYGLRIDSAGCQVVRASMGKTEQSYQFCRVKQLSTGERALAG
jgi:hypothetical protein